MSLVEVILTAFALSMDAFAVAICKGLSVSRLRIKHILITGLYFGGFQALMPAIGYFLGASFEKYITSIDHWIAFLLLIIIGGSMIREALNDDDDKLNDSFSFGAMLPLAVATSIDALAAGVSFAFLDVDIMTALILIGTITFALSAGGVAVGYFFGSRYKKKAELAGGAVLILIGLKILLEHLGIISF